MIKTKKPQKISKKVDVKEKKEIKLKKIPNIEEGIPVEEVLEALEEKIEEIPTATELLAGITPKGDRFEIIEDNGRKFKKFYRKDGTTDVIPVE